MNPVEPWPNCAMSLSACLRELLQLNLIEKALERCTRPELKRLIR